MLYVIELESFNGESPQSNNIFISLFVLLSNVFQEKEVKSI